MPSARLSVSKAASQGASKATVDLGQYDRLQYRAQISVYGTSSIGGDKASEATRPSIDAYGGSDIEARGQVLNQSISAGRVEVPDDLVCQFKADAGEKILIEVNSPATTADETSRADVLVQIDWY